MNWHIVPIDDFKPHDQSETCACKPAVQYLPNGDALVVHNSYDGREVFEQAGESLRNTN